MSFSGGVYTLPGPALVTGEVVSAPENNQFRNDVAGAFNVTMLRNGTSTATANLPMGGYKLTGLGVATTSGDALSYGQAAVISDFTASGTVTISSGTANGVAYLNGSKVLTTGSALTFGGSVLSLSSASAALSIAGTTNPYIQLNDNTASSYIQLSGGLFNFAAGGSYPFSWNTGGSEQMRLTSTGLGIGTSSPSYKLDVSLASGAGLARFSGPEYAQVVFAGGSQSCYIQNWNSASAFGTPGATPLLFTTNSTERMRLDSSGNLGLGVTPSAWWGGAKAIDVLATASFSAFSDTVSVSNNFYVDSTLNNRYKTTNYASWYKQLNGQHIFYTAPSGTAGNPITFTQAMTLTASGNQLLGTTTEDAGFRLKIVGGSLLMGASSTSSESIYIGSNAMLSSSASGAPLRFGINGTEQMRIDTSGNVGIGATTTGYHKLEVSADYNGNDYGQIAAHGVTDPTLTIGMGYNTTGDYGFITALKRGTGYKNIVICPSGGNVGIGTSSPAVLLDVVKNQNALTALNVFNNDPTNASSIAAIRVGYNSTFHYSIARYGNSADIIHNATQSSANLIWQIGSSEKARIDSSGNLKFDSGYGSVATAYGCRAWVNFDGTAAGTWAGGSSTVTRNVGTTTCTVTTASAHGLITGNVVYNNAITGLAAGTRTVTVTNSTTFTFTSTETTSLAAATITFAVNSIRASGNVSSIADNGVGDYTINFTSAMPDANYVALFGVDTNKNNITLANESTSIARTTSTIRCYLGAGTGAGSVDRAQVNVSIFR